MRQVKPEDAPELARLIQACGLDDNPNEQRIASVILNTSRATLVETSEDGALIGFVDAFMTVSREGLARWEIDLLGVHPNHQGRGIAQGLINAVVETGREQGAKLIRALIQVENGASAGAFRRCHFVEAQSTRELYVSNQQIETSLSLPDSAHLMSVCTLTYNGVWLEGEPSAEALSTARAVRAKYGWMLAGILLPTGAVPPEGFARVGEYRWWTLTC